jgi:hypothetical protein
MLLSREIPLTLEVKRLALRASMRVIALLGLERGTVPLSASILGRIWEGDSPLTWTLGRREVTVAVLVRAGLTMVGFVLHSSMQSSVRLRQMLSAFRRTCRSAADAPPKIELAECKVPCGPALPASSANAMASEAVASSVRYTDGATCCLALPRASLRRGCTFCCPGVPAVDSAGESVTLRWCLGDDETVVTDVLAVLGLSADALATAAPEVVGIFPPSSILRILDFSSSNSSHTEAAGPVESRDSVPSAREAVSGCAS